MKKSFYILFVITVSIVMSNCQRDKYQFDQIPDLNPAAYVTPVAVVEFTMAGFLESLDEQSLQLDPDSSLRLVYEVDSLIRFETVNFFELANDYTYNFPFAVPFLTVQPEQVASTVTIAQMQPTFDASTNTAVNNANGNTVPFPQIDNQLGGTHSLPSFNTMGQIEILNGEFQLAVTNNWPADIQSLDVEVYSGLVLIGTYNFSNLSSGNTQAQIQSFSGSMDGGNLSYSITNIASNGTISPVAVSIADDISFDFSHQNVNSNDGTFVPETGELFAVTSALNLSFPFQEEVIEITFSEGSVNATANGSPSFLNYELSFPAINLGSDTLSVPFDQQAPGSSPIVNYVADLTTDPLQPFNTIPIRWAVSSNATSQVTVQPSDLSFSFDMRIDQPNFSLVKGYFGQRNQSISGADASFSIEFLESISGNIVFSDPSLYVTTTNSMGVPVEVDVDINGANSSSASQASLAGSPQVIGFPDLSQIGQYVDGEVPYTPQNSDIVNFLSILPNEISMAGSLVSNPNGNTPPMQNHLIGDGEAIFGIRLELGLDFKIDDLFLTDTISLESMDVDLGDTLSLNSLKLYMNSLNGFGLTADLQLRFLDENNQVIDIQDLPLLSAAQVDSNGKVIDATLSKSELEIDQAILEQLESGSKIVFRLSFNSPNNGTNDMILHYTNFLKLYLAAEVNVSVEL
jgi:hypothetical protein